MIFLDSFTILPRLFCPRARGYGVLVADGNQHGAAAKRSATGMACLGSVAAIAWLTFVAKHLGWLEAPAFPHELSPPFGLSTHTARLASAVLVGAAAGVFGAALARAFTAPAAAWLTPLLAAAHPLTHELTHDASAVNWLAAWTIGAIALVFALPRFPRATIGALLLAAVVATVWNAGDMWTWTSSVVALGAPGGLDVGVPWKRRAAFAAPLIILLFMGHRRRHAGDERPMITAFIILLAGVATASSSRWLEVRPDLAPTGIPHAGSISLQVLGLAGILAMAAGRAWAHPSDRIVVVASLALMGFSGFNTANISDARLTAARDQISTLLSRLDELPSLDGVEYADVVIGRTVVGSDLDRYFVDRDVRSVTDLIDPGLGRQLRVSRFGLSREGWLLDPMFRATRVDEKRLSLHDPPAGAAIPASEPAHEPTFSWSVPEDQDPGPAGFMFAFAGHPIDAATRTVRRVVLEPAQLARELRNGRAFYAWRPSVRGGSHKELLWEREDLTRRGTHLTWTIVARPKGRLHGTLMAAPRKLSALR